MNNELKKGYIYPTSEIVKDEIGFLGMSQKELASRLNVSEKHISKFLNDNVNLTIEMAIGLEKAIGIPVSTLMNYESNYRESLARINRLNELKIEDYEKYCGLFKIDFMIKNKWLDISPKSSKEEQLEALLKYFGVSDFVAFYNTYNFDKKLLKCDFKLDGIKVEPLSAWLRKCEKELEKDIDTIPFEINNIDSCVKELKNLLVSVESTLFGDIKTILNRRGIRFVVVKSIPTSQVRGAVMWIKDNPAIMLSDRFKTNDYFWFALFHEIYHIKNYDKKNIVFELDDQEITDIEKQADMYSADQLIDGNKYKEKEITAEDKKS